VVRASIDLIATEHSARASDRGQSPEQRQAFHAGPSKQSKAPRLAPDGRDVDCRTLRRSDLDLKTFNNASDEGYPVLCSPAMNRSSARGILILATSLVGPAASAHADKWTSPPTVPAALAVPAAAKVAAHFHAIGAQVYECAATPDTTSYGWTLTKPDATLYDRKGLPAGTHGAGPTWTSKDGSSVIGKKVAQADAPAADADAVPWLLLRADKTAGRGVFDRITFVQRVETKHGKAPSAKCDAGTKGAERRVDYSADYYFYVGGGADSPAR
jgi:hypothetical protein